MAEYIAREVLLAQLRAIESYNASPMYRRGYDDCVEAILKTPAADVVPVVHGRWERDADGDWYCTNCDEVVAICESGRERTYRKPYCPNCGAKMDGGASND